MDNRVVVYIEKVDRKNKYLLLDFPINKGGTDYYQNFLIQSNAEPLVKEASMIEIHDVEFEKHGTPKEGLYYEIPNNLLNEEVWNQGIVVEEEDSPYIAFKISTKNSGPLNFRNALRYSQFVQNTDNDRPDNLEAILAKFNRLSVNSKSIKLIVRDIGQGNMNEIHFAPESFIMFDMGAKRTNDILPKINGIGKLYRRVRVINKIMCLAPKESFRGFVLSHWDIDHYNALLYIENQDLDEFEIFVVPEMLPTKTSKRAFDRIAQRNVLAVPMRHRTTLPNSTRFQPIFNNGLFILYRGSRHYNRNKSGLTITAHKNNADVLLSGDTHYDQIDNYMLSQCSNKDLYVVMPHHGGEAGETDRILGWNNLSEAAISVGKNQWNHPLKAVTDALDKKIGINKVHNTIKANQDYYKIL